MNELRAAEQMRAAALEEAAQLCIKCADVFEANNADSDARYPLEYAARMIRRLAEYDLRKNK